MLEGSNEVFPSDIAVVGMALRVPGARNVKQFWANLRDGVESIRTLSTEELLAEGEGSERIHHPNYVPRCADLAGMEMFDADFFGLSPKEAAIMDPQHRHFLECVWEAIEDSGRIPMPGGEPVGVFAGCGMGSYFYFNVCSNRHLVDQVGMFLLRHTGNDKDFLSTRASFTFDLRGPSVNVQTACSTSLVAIHYACQSLMNGECDTAIAGGVTIELPHRHGYTFNEGEILSPDGHCRPFDHRAVGTVFGSGVGVVMLRRLSDALKDGDIIHTVIKGTAINNDGGSKSGYLAPSVDGQAAAIIEAQGLAGVRADSIGYVECHGTGTYLGDPIEIEGLTQAFRQSTDSKGFCHVGSVKSNIGHLDTAAGVIGLIKAALVLKYGEIPPTLGFESPNPSINFAQSPFMVNNTLVKWPATGGRRRAAVNSLGVGGTNAHAILEQPPASYMAERAMDATAEHAGDNPLFLLLSARHRKGLELAAERLSSTMIEQPELALDDIGFTLLRGRKHFEHRLILPVRHRQHALAALSDIERGFVHAPVENPTGAVFLFPGGGAQYPNMARALYDGEKTFRSHVDEGLSYLSLEAAAEIRTVWFGDAAADAAKVFRRPSVQLPAIHIVEVALARLWVSWGVKPVALIGHSMGEYAAACLSGVMTFKDAVRLVRLRGELFETVPKGGMLSVPLEAKVLAERLPSALDIASINAPALCVVSGLDVDLDDFRDALARDGIDASRIPIDIAAHSRLLESILAPFEAFLRTISLRHPSIPIISNGNGLPLSNQDAADPMYWVGHLRGTVRFAEGMATLAANPGHIYLEVGPGRVLSSLTKMQGSIPANQVINSLPHPDEAGDDHLYFMAAIGRAFATGLYINVDRLWEGLSPKRITLPTYPFQHRRFFIERSKEVNASEYGEMVLAKEPDLAQWGYRPTWKQSLPGYEQGAEKERHDWLFLLDEPGLGLRLAEKLRAFGHRVATASLSDSFTKRGIGDYTLCPELGRAGYDALLAGLAADGALPSRIVHMWLVTEEEKHRPGSNFFYRNQECGFHSLLHLAQAIGDLPDAINVHFTVISNGMQQVGSEALPYPEKATILGPALVLPKEMEGATVKLIDVDLPHKATQAAPGFELRHLLARKAGNPAAEKATTIADQLWEELNAPSISETVALRQGRRWSRTRCKMPLPEISPRQTKLRQNGVYFFAAGLSEVALAIAGEFARQLQAKIVLVGRTVLPTAENWDFYEKTHGHDSLRRAIAAIRQLESNGAEVLYLTGDVTNLEEMTKAAEVAKSRFGRIDGVFHAAGVIDDNLIQAKTQDSIERVLAPKVLGTTILASVFEDYRLDFFLMFSSTSTDVIRAGQVDYVAANAYLNAFAQSASLRTDRTTIAVHWGIWNEVGLAARAVGASRNSGSAISSAKPVAGTFFQNWIEDEQGVPWLEATVNPTTNWMLNEHRLVSGQAVMPGTGYLEMIAQAAREYGLPFEVDIKDLVFLTPMVFAGAENKIIRVRLEPVAGKFRAIVTAGRDGAFTRHSDAVVEARVADCREPLNVASLAARCETKSVAEGGAVLKSVQEEHIRFGARWRVLQSMAVGRGEALAQLALDPAYVGDLADGALLHPALLDIATGFALALADEYKASNSLWAPATYEQVSLHGPLPERVVSWARLADNQNFGPGYAVFDIDIADRDGRVLFEARGFVMQRLDGNLHLGEVASDRSVSNTARKHEAASPTMLKLASQVRNGILPSEGFDVLARAIATGEPQPILSSINLDALEKWVEKSETSAIAKGEEFERPELESEFMAPRNPVEETIASYWRELLGIAQIGVHDSFFDIGGHSLIAVRLFRMLKGQYGVDLPISFLFEAPTIAQCADHILSRLPNFDQEPTTADQAQDPPLTKPTHVVLLSGGKDASATPLFICAGMFGNVLNLRHLASALSIDRTVYGLQARGLYGDYAPHATFEEMARDYIAEIQAIQPHGPYLLAGYSGGGICAYEMALQILDQGDEVAHVIMLDTPLPRQPELQMRDRIDMKLQDLKRHRAGLLKQWLSNRREWKAELRDRVTADTVDCAAEEFNNKKIEVAFRRALLQYEVRPYTGALTLFRPKPIIFYQLSGGRTLQENRNIILHDNGWGGNVLNLHISEVPGDHDSMVLDPYVRVLASRIRTILSGALEPRTSRFEKPRLVSLTNKEHRQHVLVEDG
jgi:acyl transferase domain-containing protein/thioesterase domain-containing protein